MRYLAIGFLGTLCPIVCLAQTAPAIPPAAPPTPVFGDATKEVTEANAPAFSLMGVQGETITAPEGLKAFGLALINGLNEDEDAQSGLGIQFAPTQLLAPRAFTYDAYRTSYATRALARLHVNLALAQSQDETHPNALRGAAGFTWVAFDTTDPFANEALYGCLKQYRPTVEDSVPDPNAPLGQTPPIVDKKYQANAVSCRKKYNKTPSDGYSAQIGFAKTLFSDTGKTSDLKGAGYGVNGVVSIGLNGLIKPTPREGDSEHVSGLDSRLLIGALYRKRESIVDPGDDSKFTTRDRFSAGGRLLLGDDRKLIFGLEFLHQDARYANGLRDRYSTYSATLDIKIAHGLWINASYGDSSGKDAAVAGSARFSGGLRYSAGPKASLGSNN